MLEAIGLAILGLVTIVAALVLYFSCEPGQRRRRADPNYHGPERRSDKTEVDFLEQPMFTFPSCKGCDRILKFRSTCKYCGQNHKVAK